MSPTGRVRHAVAADLPRLIALDPIAALGDADRVELLRSAQREGRCLVLASDRGPVGYVISAPKGFLGRDFVELLMVDSQRRRTGVGRTLLRAAVAGATTSRVFTSTNRSNRALCGLLESEQWSYSGLLDGLDEGDPELVYFVDT